MNHFVPEFDMDVDYSIPTSSGLPRQKNMPDDEILELIWHNGQVVVQSQNPRLQRKSSPPQTKFPPEDELMSWLQYQLEDSPLFCLPPPHHRLTQAPIRSEAPLAEVNFPHLSRTTARFPESGPSTSSRNNEIRESMVDSSDTPAIQQKPNFPAVEIAERENPCMSVSREVNTCDLTLTTSSPGGSGLFGRGGGLSATATTDLMALPPADDRKRKGREPVDKTNTEYQSEDVEIKSYEPKKQTRGAITRRSRAAEVHNLSERRRRDKINEKMRTLQELIPQSSKTDKVSTLDEAIEYLKSLQMQVQMMSIGCGMVPMMYPGAQQYMSSLGMGMGMGMGMNPQMMPFPGALSGSAMPTPVGAPSQLNPRFPLPSFQMPSIPGTDPSRIQQAGNQGDFNMAMIPSLPHPYQHSTNIQQASMQMAQNQPSIGKLSAYRGGKYNENPSTG